MIYEWVQVAQYALPVSILDSSCEVRIARKAEFHGILECHVGLLLNGGGFEPYKLGKCS